MKFTFLKTFNSPFKRPKLKWYFGKVAIGTPYFYPRKIIGFDFVRLGYKTKWHDTDYRLEWSPVWSFVFFKWQIAVTFIAPHTEHYWTCWLTYENNTDKTSPVEERIKIAKEINPETWTSSYGDGKKETICYWDKVLKEKYL